MGKGKGSTDEYPFMQTPDLLSHFLHLGYTNSTLSPIWAPTVRRNPPLTLTLHKGLTVSNMVLCAPHVIDGLRRCVAAPGAMQGEAP